MTTPTQVARPWRTTLRSLFQGFVAFASVAPMIYSAAFDHDPALATGWAATGLGIAAAVTRLMATQVVDDFLAKFLPFLATQPKKN